MRLIATLILAALATACATPDEAQGWTDDTLTTDTTALTREAAREEPAALAASEDTLSDADLLVAEAEAEPVRGGDEPGDGGDPVCGKKIPTRVEISRDHIYVEWNDGSTSNYCYNQETGQYQAC